jgi:hypothetical protein
MLIFVQGDTAPELLTTIHEAGDPTKPVNLTDAQIRVQMRKSDDRRYTVNAEAEVIDPEAGKVRYRWGPNDLANTGEYLLQWEVVYPDARIQTTVSPERITVRRQ